MCCTQVCIIIKISLQFISCIVSSSWTVCITEVYIMIERSCHFINYTVMLHSSAYRHQKYLEMSSSVPLAPSGLCSAFKYTVYHHIKKSLHFISHTVSFSRTVWCIQISHPLDKNIPFYRCLRFFYSGLLSQPWL